MSLSIFDISVSSYRRALVGLGDCLDLGQSQFVKLGIDPEELKLVRLAPDMLPFDFQVQAVVHHCLGGVKAITSGEFGPAEVQDLTYAELQNYVRTAVASLDKVLPASINEYAGQMVTFRHGDVALPFTVENFLLAFSLPNLYFHVTTAYDILRMNGVLVCKSNFLGELPTN